MRYCIGLYTQLYTVYTRIHVYVWTATTRIHEIYAPAKKITPPSENLKTGTDPSSWPHSTWLMCVWIWISRGFFFFAYFIDRQ